MTLFGATLVLSLLLPIYTDEITWKAVTSRTFLDGFVNMWVFPQCKASFAVAPPWFMLPARVIDDWLYSNLSHPEWLRLSGAVLLLCWLSLSLVALPRLVRGASGLPALALGSAVLSLGVLPLALMLNRPEQLLRLLVTLLVLAPFALRGKHPGPLGAVLRAFFLVLAATMLFAHHPKSLYFVPVVLVAGFYVIPGARLRILTAAAVLLLGWAATDHWYARLSCPEDPWVQTFVDQKMINPSSFLGGQGQTKSPQKGDRATPATAPSLLEGNLFRSSRYVTETFIEDVYSSNWLPRSDAPPWAPVLNGAIAAVWFGVALLAAWTCVRLALEAVRSRRLSPQAVMVFALSLPLAGQVLLEGHKAFYESSLVLPFLAFIPALGWRPAGRKALQALAEAALLTVAMASMVTLWAALLPDLPGWLSRGYVPRQRLSISAFGASDARREIQADARLCGIDPTQPLNHLVVDPLTYTAFDRLRQPYFALYLFDHANKDVLDLLADRGSSGMVVSCGTVPRFLRSRTRRLGHVCCIPAFQDARGAPRAGAPRAGR